MSTIRRPVRRIVLAIYALCFAIGGANHARDFVQRGWRPYGWAPLPAFELYWSALILLDFGVVLLLSLRRTRSALILAAGVMMSDVAINVTATRLVGASDFGSALLLQAAFLGFILGSIGFLWPRSCAGVPATAGDRQPDPN